MEPAYTPTGAIEEASGPLEAWENPDGYWSAELAAAVDECRAGERTSIACPACGAETHSMAVDTVYREHAGPTGVFYRGGTVGQLVTLYPCEHKLKR